MEDSTSGVQLAAIDWYNGMFGYTSSTAKSLAVCFTNGRCQMMRNEEDESKILLSSFIVFFNKSFVILNQKI